jgi:signal peptidase II
MMALLSGQPVIEVTGFLKLVTVWNYGISFGLFNRGSPAIAWVFIGIALAISVGLVVWLARVEQRLTALALALVIGGAVGNVIDRLRHGAVFDFVYFHVQEWYWPAFNLADSAISVGVALLFIESLFVRPHSIK